MKHYIWHPLNWGEAPKDPAWVKARAELYRRFVRPQLAAQTCRDFATVLYIRREDEAALMDLWEPLVDHVVIYDEDRLASDAMLEWDCDQDWIYWTRLDVDDLLATDAVEFIQAKRPVDNTALVWTPPGYCYDIRSKRWGLWQHDYQPNSTIIIPGARWQDREAAHAYAYCKHGEVKSRFAVTRLPSGRYCNLIHGLNKLNTMRNELGGAPPTARERFPVLFEDGQ